MLVPLAGDGSGLEEEGDNSPCEATAEVLG